MADAPDVQSRLFFETAVTCGQPPQVQHGKVEGADFHWGSSISYSCVDGFQPSHSAILSCEGRGVWKGEVPQCLRKSPSNACSWVTLHWTMRSTLSSRCEENSDVSSIAMLPYANVHA